MSSVTLFGCARWFGAKYPIVGSVLEFGRKRAYTLGQAGREEGGGSKYSPDLIVNGLFVNIGKHGTS